MADYIIPGFLFFVVIILAGALGGFMAADRGRHVVLWCILCALLPPLLLVLYFIKPLSAVEGRFRKCVKCGALIKWHALVCRYCQSVQDGAKR
jgi:hypothetical protein